MKVKEWADGALILDGNIERGIDEAFNDGRYVEAFVLLHGLIDWLMASLYQLEVVMGGHATSENAWRLIEERKYTYVGTLQFLRENGILDDNERDRLLKFNEARNKVIHRMIRRHFQTRADPKTRITRQEAIEAFNDGRALVSLLRAKGERYVPDSLIPPKEAAN